MKEKLLLMSLAAAMILPACEPVDTGLKQAGNPVHPEDVARIIAGAGIGEEQIGEVYDAVSSSSINGYDEEYLLKDIFLNPGYGVGEKAVRSGDKTYDRPLRDLIRESLEASATKSSPMTPDEYIEAMIGSGMQIYWPYSENWDGKSSPVITFAPDFDSEVNVGWRYIPDGSGKGTVEEVLVDEELAMERPVWVINGNDDSGMTTLEMLRRQDPSWGEGGGEIIVRPRPAAASTKASSGHKMLVLKEFTMKKNFDSWFAGASEFVVQAGSVEGFYASTEAELKLYYPSVTQFGIVVRRTQKNKPVEFNAVLVSDWTEQIENCAMLVTEDDGGETTSWKCSITGRIKSKSYGFDVNIPYRDHDDIAWRGQLSRSYMESNAGMTGHFGDIDLKFELVDY